MAEPQSKFGNCSWCGGVIQFGGAPCGTCGTAPPDQPPAMPADPQHPDWNYRCNLWRAGLGPDPGPPPDPQHPAVPFEQAVDLLTGEPRQLRPQHPDIAALVERLRLRAYRIRAIGFVDDESAADADLAADNLEALARPVEDEKVRDQIGFLGRVADHIARVLSPATAEKVRQAASLLARLAREKASAEQEAARLREALRKFGVHRANCAVYQRGDEQPCNCGYERAIAAEAGAEEPKR